MERLCVVIAMQANLTAQISEKIEEATDGSKLVSAMDAILLQPENLAWTQQILPGHVGVHPSNRDGLGLSSSPASSSATTLQLTPEPSSSIIRRPSWNLRSLSSEVHSLIDDILGVGFSHNEVRGIALELLPGDQSCGVFNKLMLNIDRYVLKMFAESQEFIK